MSVCLCVSVCVYVCLCLCVCVCRPVLFQSSESVADSDVVGDVIPYSIALHLLYTRAHPDIKPPYQVLYHHRAYQLPVLYQALPGAVFWWRTVTLCVILYVCARIMCYVKYEHDCYHILTVSLCVCGLCSQLGGLVASTVIGYNNTLLNVTVWHSSSKTWWYHTASQRNTTHSSWCVCSRYYVVGRRVDNTCNAVETETDSCVSCFTTNFVSFSTISR